MIVDSLNSAGIYRGLGARIAGALDYLGHTDFESLAPGRYDIEGDALFAIVQDYASKPEVDGRWECHRRYIDAQLVVSGVERIGYAPAASLDAGPYDAERDITFLEGSGSFVTMPAGHVMLLWPGDAHMPGIASGEPCAVRKVVVKIALA